MRPYACPNCQRLNHFEVRVCPGCKATLGYDPAADTFRFLADDATAWRDGSGHSAPLVACANNNALQICNWLVARNGPAPQQPLCLACRHNRLIPDLSGPQVPQRWAKIEAAKRRLFHTLLRLGLPITVKSDAPGAPCGFAFDFLYDPAAEAHHTPHVITGHDDGLITLNLIEADDAERERIRHAMGEPYRTLLGHFRHEIGHHYWSALVWPNGGWLAEFRSLFGDERADYTQSLQAHYTAQPGQWSTAFISFYATSHPWEDFAETFAHYLHSVDLLATGAGLALTPAGFNPYAATAPDLVDAMRPVAFAMNAMNRSMGLPDAYPFHFSPPIVAKLGFVQRLCHAFGRGF